MMGHSLAEDGDLTYRREDLVRVWQRVPVRARRRLPEEGRDIIDAGLMRLRRSSGRAPRRSRPEAALLRQVVRLSAVRRAVRAAVRHQRLSRAARAAAGARRLVRLPVPARADARDAGRGALAAPSSWRRRAGLFRLDHAGALQLLARRSSRTSAGSTRRWRRRSVRRAARAWLFGAASDSWPRVLLGIATFSKVTNALLFLPIVAWLLWRRRWRRAVAAGVGRSASCAAGCSLANMAISGEWNYPGRRAPHVRLRVPVPDADVDLRGRRCRWAATSRWPRSSSTGACSGRT